jgi:hypothetical protein
MEGKEWHKGRPGKVQKQARQGTKAGKERHIQRQERKGTKAQRQARKEQYKGRPGKVHKQARKATNVKNLKALRLQKYTTGKKKSPKDLKALRIPPNKAPASTVY